MRDLNNFLWVYGENQSAVNVLNLFKVECLCGHIFPNRAISFIRFLKENLVSQAGCWEADSDGDQGAGSVPGSALSITTYWKKERNRTRQREKQAVKTKPLAKPSLVDILLDSVE